MAAIGQTQGDCVILTALHQGQSGQSRKRLSAGGEINLRFFQNPKSLPRWKYGPITEKRPPAAFAVSRSVWQIQ